MGTRNLAALAVFLLVLSGCADPVPYIFRSGEFGREAKSLSRDRTDVNTVDICYNRRATSPAELQEMARAECAKFDKVPRYTKGSFLSCPIFLPLGAHFNCGDP